MSNIKIKICGLSRPQDIEMINIHKPDYAGFVFAAGSRRQVTAETAARLSAQLMPGIIPVGVFVDEEPESILALVDKGTIAAVQLHGAEDEDYIRRLKSRLGVPVIKAVGMAKAGDAQKWENSAADYLLLDNVRGGSGECFDWGMIGELGKPYFLAGGLNAQNAAEALQKTRAFALDVSGGVETDGVKDASKIGEFVGKIHNS